MRRYKGGNVGAALVWGEVQLQLFPEVSSHLCLTRLYSDSAAETGFFSSGFGSAVSAESGPSGRDAGFFLTAGVRLFPLSWLWSGNELRFVNGGETTLFWETSGLSLSVFLLSQQTEEAGVWQFLIGTYLNVSPDLVPCLALVSFWI